MLALVGINRLLSETSFIFGGFIKGN